ncbi:hypothetical protein COU20_01430 [Candidatus Kaiserbacteria bacterium CG10_big_fil_rev_8_21_14_0_10_59_10]|uniref:Uncharacterized protein n=1 Tax=Candidatus Kaiserbacteria bacterium CG10_big_fil_rev_8_21_14_0_10_59_10 TaxID=1974612 RepID=A0A2H0UA82_9BACT|nr:MAG: hypothetical protein COU20_01430 [Candidatus Kaiserbacteria bacterium CG10_big_fil_rev_8_21_14_0_10_59_10]
MRWEEDQKLLTGLLALLLVASVTGNVLLYRETQRKEPTYALGDIASYSSAFESPGFRNEIITVFDGKQFRTYATSTPLSESDILRMRAEVEKEFERVNEFFKRQDELFRSLWNF